jgi:hypothetical protein
LALVRIARERSCLRENWANKADGTSWIELAAKLVALGEDHPQTPEMEHALERALAEETDGDRLRTETMEAVICSWQLASDEQLDRKNRQSGQMPSPTQANSPSTKG